MKPRRSRCIAWGAGSCWIAAMGCSALTDFDKFQGSPSSSAAGAGGAADDGGPIVSSGRAYDNLDLTLDRFIPHAGHYFEYRIVSDKNIVAARGAIDAIPDSGLVRMYVPNAVPTSVDPAWMARTFRLDMFASVDDSRAYTQLGPFGSLAHAWRINRLRDFPLPNPLSDDDGIVKIVYRHNSDYDDINAVDGTVSPPLELGGKLLVHVKNGASLQEKALELHLIEKDSRQVIGFFLMVTVTQTAFEIALPHYVDYTTDYEVELYADSNGNQTVDVGDLAWNFAGKSTSAGVNAGLELTFDPTADNAKIFAVKGSQGRTGP